MSNFIVKHINIILRIGLILTSIAALVNIYGCITNMSIFRLSLLVTDIMVIIFYIWQIKHVKKDSV